MNFDDRSTGAGRFFGIAEALCQAVGKAVRPGFIGAAMALLVVLRIQRVRRILWALEARFLAGLAVRRGTRVPVAGDVAVVREQVVPVAVLRLPRRFGWLFPMVPGDAACYSGQLLAVLAEPEMQALLAACPQAVRVLRPLCRMLGIARADYVPAGVDVGRAVVARVRVRAPRKVRVTVDPEVEDAHFAFTQTPRRFRLRVG
jgi:hypothetical protein